MRLLLVFVALALVTAAAAQLRRVCYYTNWAQYRNGPAKFFPENEDPNLCTHIIYAFAKLAGNKLTAFEWNDESTPWMKGMYERFAAVKKTNPSVKLLLSVGGWNMASAPFTRMVATDASRREFATSTVQFLRKHNFDGIDIDWEYPANRGSPPGDRQKYTQLLKTVHDVFAKETVPAGKETLMMAAAVAAGKSKIDTGYDVPEVCRYLDMLNLMTYDLHGSWEDHTGHSSPLYGRAGEVGNETTLNVDWAAQYWVSKGCPKAKMNIGMALYGRTFKLPYGHTSDGMGAPASGAGPAGRYTREAGFISYYEVCEKLKSGAVRHYEAQQKVPYFVDGDLWCGYEDADSLRLKVDYVVQEGFGGVMVWSLDLDDFSGSCGQGKYPLLKAIVQEAASATPGPGGAVHQTAPPTPAPTTRTTAWQPPPQKTTTARVVMPTQTKPIQTTTTQRLTTTQAPITTTQAQTTTQQITTTAAPKPTTTAADKTTTAAPVVTTTASPVTNVNHHEIVAVSSTEFSCSGRNDGYYPSTTSCTEYFICAAAVAFKTDCHPGLYFNAATLYCDFSDHVSCKRSPQTPHTVVTPAPVTPQPTMRTTTTMRPTMRTPAPTTQAPQTPPPITTTTASAPGSNFCQGKQDGFYRDPTDCSYFYQCSFNTAYHDPCPSGTYFSTALQGCDWAANVPGCP